MKQSRTMKQNTEATGNTPRKERNFMMSTMLPNSKPTRKTARNSEMHRGKCGLTNENIMNDSRKRLTNHQRHRANRRRKLRTPQ